MCVRRGGGVIGHERGVNTEEGGRLATTVFTYHGLQHGGLGLGLRGLDQRNVQKAVRRLPTHAAYSRHAAGWWWW